MATVKYPSLTHPARIYFDDGCSTSYVTSQFARQVGLQFSGYQYISVGRFGSNKRQNKRFRTALLPIPLSDGTTFTLPVNIIDTITTKVQRVPLDPQKYPELQFLPLADTQNPSFQKVGVDILIGGDSLHELFTGERINVTDGLFLYGSKLGYVAAGSVEVTDCEDSFNQTTAVCHFSQATAFQTPQTEVKRFWSLEDLGIKDNPYVTDDELALDSFQQTVSKVDGRLTSLQRRLKQQEDVLLQYDSILNEQAKTGIIEEVKQARTDNKVHYIPHHCVFRSDSSTTKLRIVYDASSKLSRHSPSLNESLLRGPVTIQNLWLFLLRFRISRIAMLCDIEMAFHQISIRLQDRDALQFMWLENPLDPATKPNLRTFRFCRVPFGMICSPFLLDGCIRHHLSSKQTEMADDILKNIYVDNIQGGQSSLPDSIVFFEETKRYFEKISMNAREWYSNNKAFQDHIPKVDQGQSKSPKVLGLPSNTESDRLSLSQSGIDGSVCTTKRQFLSQISVIFDPCGWISPVVVRAKLVVQEMWKTKRPWDQAVTQEMQNQFAHLLLDLHATKEISIPRQVHAYVGSQQAKHELHCFVDASAKAYAGAVYLRSILPTGKICVDIVFAKSRLAPIKPVTIPRLELMAAVTGSRLIQFVESELATKVTCTAKYLWSDCKCVLHWLASKQNLKVFVANRISKINKASGVEHRYVPTAYNPADIPSKGISAEDLKNSDLWWSGPRFLLLKKEMWPENIADYTVPSEAEIKFAKKHQLLLTNATPNPAEAGISCLINPNDFSSWDKLIRVTAFVLKAVDNFKCKRGSKKLVSNVTPFLEAQYSEEAQRLWLPHTQKEIVPTNHTKGVYSNAHLRYFNDENGLIRCKSRLDYSDLDSNAKYPILLPKDNHITDLIIRSHHSKLAHAGVRQTLANIRRYFWIPHGRRQVTHSLKSCMHCRKVHGGPFRAPVLSPESHVHRRLKGKVLIILDLCS